MAFRRVQSFFSIAALTLAGFAFTTYRASAQVFVVGEKTATADITTDFHPTRVELPSKPINELGRRELLRDLEAEQGFAHRPLPLGPCFARLVLKRS